VSGRSILDNAMAAIEVRHFMQTKTRGNDRYVALKLDISKPMIEWIGITSRRL